jgi:hypothetical protein
MKNRTLVRILTAGLVIVAALLGTGCTSNVGGSGEASQTPAGAAINPLVPANTARGTVDKANDAAAETQRQLDQATTP